MHGITGRRSTKLLVASVVAFGACVLSLGLPASGQAPARTTPTQATGASSLPTTVPTLRHWSPAPGRFLLRPGAKIVPTSAAVLADAQTFQRDLFTITGIDLPITSGRGRAGDIILGVKPQGLPASGYTLSIGDTVNITGQDGNGLFYGTQSIEQMFKAAPGMDSLPRGKASDWPSLQIRGTMLLPSNAPISYLEEEIRTAAWNKLNEVHLDLADTTTYELPSSQFPGLPTRGHYTVAEIAALVDYAHRYHVTLVPEIDVPGHATELTQYDHSLRWSCPSIENKDYYGSTGYPFVGYTINVTKPAALHLVEKLVGEVIKMFPYSPVIHIGGDEYPSYKEQQDCPELVSYAKTHGFATTEDVFVNWQDELARYIESRGRQAEIWNWWNIVGHATITPSKSIIIEPWIGPQTSAYDGPNGYRVIVARDDDTPNYFQYISPLAPPGGPEVPEDINLYSTWTPATSNPKVLGYESPMWTYPFAFGSWFAQNAWTVMADRTWDGQRLPSLFDFEDVADEVGAPPGFPDDVPTGQNLLHGTPYGSPAVDAAQSPAAAFDGNPATYYESALKTHLPYVGIDLGQGKAARVTAVRFIPVADPNPDSYQPGGLFNSLDLVGGEFQGCQSGPASGCVNLAKVRWRSTFDWHQLTVTDPGRFRWLRFLSASGRQLKISEIQFLTAPVTPQHLQVTPPHLLLPGTTETVTGRFTNRSDSAVTDVRASMLVTTAVEGYSAIQFILRARPVTRTVVGPGRSVVMRWRVSVPAHAMTGPDYLDARVTYQTGPFSAHQISDVTKAGVGA